MHNNKSTMTIERNGEKIQLTKDELRNAFCVYQEMQDREDIEMGLKIIKERGVLSDGKMNETIDGNKLLEKYDISNNEEVITDLVEEYRYVFDENASEWEKYRYAALENLVFHLEEMDAAIEKIHNGEAYYGLNNDKLVVGEKGADTLFVYDLPRETAKKISIEAAKKGNSWADNLPNAPKKVYENPTKKELIALFNRGGWFSTEEYHKGFVLPELRREKAEKQLGR